MGLTNLTPVSYETADDCIKRLAELHADINDKRYLYTRERPRVEDVKRKAVEAEAYLEKIVHDEDALKMEYNAVKRRLKELL
jgi:hypothetical protein